MSDDLTEDCWKILNLAPGAEISEIHLAFEQLRLSYLPKDRDRTAPLSDDTKNHLQRLDRAFFQALDFKKTKSPSKGPTSTRPINSTQTVKQLATLDTSVKVWSLNNKYTPVQKSSIASEDFVSPQERSQSVGGLTASFADRAVSSARWVAALLGLALRCILRLFEQFASLHVGLRTVLGAVLAIAVVWLINKLGGGSGLNADTGGNAIFFGALFGILTKYRWWLLGLVFSYLFERYFH